MEVSNLVFNIIFTLEMLLKLTALGPLQYARYILTLLFNSSTPIVTYVISVTGSTCSTQ